MNTDIIIVTVLFIAFATLMVLRTHVSLMILAGCAGFVLSLLWSPTLFRITTDNLSGLSTDTIKSFVSITLFMLPSLLVGYHFRSTQKHRIIHQILPSIFWAIFAATLTIRLLPSGYQQSFLGRSKLALLSQDFLSWIVLVAVIVAIFEFMNQHSVFNKRGPGRPSKH